jgi:hydroxymethylbilane synthase
MAAAALEEAHGWPAGHVAIRTVRTSGDRIQDRPLAEIGGKMLWTKELDVALLAGETHASVHSAKDVESVRPEALCIAACLPRADVRDRLIGADSIEALSQGARVGTSSPRRAAQLLRLRPDLQVDSIRGNVATRLGRIAAGDFDATLLAAAGLDRLDIAEGVPIAVAAMLPAPTQGAIAIECRRDDANVRALVAAVSHGATHQAITAERRFARAVGGSCHSPVAALALEQGDGSLWLRAELLSTDGADRVAGELRFPADDPAAPAALAADLLGRAPPTVRALFTGP